MLVETQHFASQRKNKGKEQKELMNQPFSYIHPSAEIADNVVIEPFVTISKDVVIGEGTWIGPHVTIMEGARIGKNCKIFPGAVISAIPQDLKYKGEKAIVEIGNNVTIREYVTVNKGTEAAMKTVIGDNSLLMAYVHIAHDCIIGKNCILANNANLAGHVEIDDFAILGGATNFQQYCKIGRHVIVSGGCLVNKDIPPFVRAARHPTTYAGVNSVGLRRRGFNTSLSAGDFITPGRPTMAPHRLGVTAQSSRALGLTTARAPIRLDSATT